MDTPRLFGTAAVVAALVGALVGCGVSAEDAGTVTTIDKVPGATDTEVCNAAAWIRERAAEGVCSERPEADDDMSLRRLHEELEHPAR